VGFSVAGLCFTSVADVFARPRFGLSWSNRGGLLRECGGGAVLIGRLPSEKNDEVNAF